MYKNVSNVEREKKPHRCIAVEVADPPDVNPQKLYGVGGKLAVEQRHKKPKERHPNHAAGDIWHQQSPGAVFDVWKCGASYRTVEITSLEKEEAHQVEAPAHYLFPPIFPIESRKLKGV